MGRVRAVHILLTDRLACPRCGPEFGLILLAHQVRDRRVLEGDLGCSNCRETYPVRRGFGDLRPPPRTPLPPPVDGVGAVEEEGAEPGGGEGVAAELARGEDSAAGPGGGNEALRLGALLGVTEGPGMILLKGPAARFGKALAGLVEHVEVVAMAPELGGVPEEEGVSRLAGRGPIPFSSGSFRGVVLSGEVGVADLEEGCRVLAPLSRLVILGGGPEAVARVRSLGLSVLLDQDGVVVARREGVAAPSPLIPLRGPQGPPTLR